MHRFKDLTERQQEVVKFMISFRKEMGRGPTRDEVYRGLKLAGPSSAWRLFDSLMRKGFVEKEKYGEVGYRVRQGKAPRSI